MDLVAVGEMHLWYSDVSELSWS